MRGICRVLTLQDCAGYVPALIACLLCSGKCLAPTDQLRFDLRQPRQRAFVSDQTARVRVAKTDTPNESLDIVQTVEQCANIAAQKRIALEFFDRVEPRVNLGEIEPRLLNPAPQ